MGSMALLFVLCHLVFCANYAGSFSPDQCRQSPVGALHPVQGLLETYRAGLGCATQGKHGHEVHVINLRRTSLDRAKQVTLHLRPISMLSVHRRPLIFVLRSQRALGWRVEAERLEPGVRHLFHVSEGSAVQSPLENFTLSLLSEKSLPSRSERLLRWTLRKYRTVTSFTEFDQVNHIYIRIGEDPMMPSSCVLKKLFLSQNYLASDLQPQEVTGCVTPGLEMDPEVHLVHLRSAGSNLSGSLQVDVMVTLQPPDALLTVWSDVILLLKCDASVNWVIKPRGVRGRLRVYASNSISIGLGPEHLALTTIVSADLQVTPDLLAWASERGFPAVTSYTEAGLANRFVVTVTKHGIVPGVADLLDSTLPLQQPQPWHADSVPMVPPGVGLEGLLKHWMSPGGAGGGGEEWRGDSESLLGQDHFVDGVVLVQCLGATISILVQVDLLQSLGLASADLTLKDPSCKVESNGTDFLLEFDVTSCGTVADWSSLGVRYRNAVLLWKPSGSVTTGNDTEEKETPPAPRGAGRSPQVINVRELGKFSCLAPSPAFRGGQPGAVRISGGLGGPPFFSMDLYSSESFLQHYPGPCIISANSRVFVEVVVLWSEPGLGLGVQSCFLSPLSDPEGGPGWTVIAGECPQDDSVTFYSEGAGGKRSSPAWEGAGRSSFFNQGHSGGQTFYTAERAPEGRGGTRDRRLFSFVLRPQYNNSVQFLHCKLTLCERGGAPPSHGAGMPRCVSLDEACTGSIAPLSDSSLWGQFGRTLSKPILVTQEGELPALGLPRIAAHSAGNIMGKPRAGSLSVPWASPSAAYVDAGLDARVVVGITFTAFLIGVCLTAALWCIYSRTDVSKQKKGNPPFNDNEDPRRPCVDRCSSSV
ncbi:transforming growth factor beta receptor type 3-like isoform X1 [Acipenser ruthenus]|uniref:transforming growth factor beta receptor type 3-like isoform X1 n=1 Tax=Acipenser ruthenus TaxID=7906 RepID=UPI0027407433|nr:transforming growth factor beta receptor type 3-like isoform X1 [Acipenser ruthenus]XP_058863002.1 transforming growth factor beta receptor type 3-like isoform X1 [Acipenser ruthenus]